MSVAPRTGAVRGGGCWDAELVPLRSGSRVREAEPSRPRNYHYYVISICVSIIHTRELHRRWPHPPGPSVAASTVSISFLRETNV